jgi:hypothetical protein
MEEIKEIMCTIIDMNSLTNPLLYSVDLTFYTDITPILSVWIKEKSTNKMHLIQNWRDTDVLEATRELAIKLST